MKLENAALAKAPGFNGPEFRQDLRDVLRFQVSLQDAAGEVSGLTENINLGGLRVICPRDLKPGTPVALEFSFGDTCYLDLSGQVTNSRAQENQSPPSYALGIKFATMRPLEATILESAIADLKQDVARQATSQVKIIVAKDSLALEAGDLFIKTEDTILDLLDRLSKVTVSAPRTICETPFPSDALPTFTLLIDGEELDTKKYRFFPHAEKLITDYKAVTEVLKQLKAGEIPANHKDYIFARYCVGTSETNLRAMEAAHRASKEFGEFPLEKRLQILLDIYELLLVHKEKLVELMRFEGHPCGLAEWEFLGMERSIRRETLEFYTTQIARQVAVEGDEVMFWRRKPDGVVCVSPPKNAPSSASFIAVLALLGGNALIVKPPLRSPISTLFLWKNVVHEALKRNGAPAGTLNLIIGNSEKIMDEWIASPYVNDILFIGDTKIGLQIGNRAFMNGKKPILELSGNDMMFIWKDAAIDEAVQSLLDGFLGSMQICMVPKKAFIHEDIYDKFELAFLAEVKKLKIGLPSDPTVTLSPVIKIDEFYEFLDDALNLGAKLLCGGLRVDHNGAFDENGRFITPAVLRVDYAENGNEMRCIKEENFFPMMPLVKISANKASSVDSKDKAIFEKMLKIADGNEYGLRISAWASSPFYIQRFMDQVHNSGLLRINCRHTGFSSYMATHGGTGKTGGPYGELNYVWQKTTHLQGITIKKNAIPAR